MSDDVSIPRMQFVSKDGHEEYCVDEIVNHLVRTCGRQMAERVPGLLGRLPGS